MSNQFQLMNERRFRPFFFTQFFGAFNDNVFKTALITLIAFHQSSLTSLDGDMLTTLLPGLFILPFFVFSATAGQLADKFEKARIFRTVKACEIGIMLFASLGFFLHNLPMLIAALIMMGIHSAFFGPVKYSYMPQHLSESELIGGNAMVEMGSFVAILLGQVLGAWLASQEHYEWLVSLGVLMVALAGYVSSRGIPHSPEAAPDLKINWNPITATGQNLALAWKNQPIWVTLLGISWFWFFGATLLAQFPNFAKHVLNGGESVFILLLSVFSVGIGAGSLMCEKWSGGTVKRRLVVMGSVGMSVFGFDLYWTSQPLLMNHATAITHTLPSFLAQATHWHLLLDVMLLGFCGGLYIVPLYVIVQTRTEKREQSRMIAANNILNALFMVASAGFSMLVLGQGYSIPELFMVTASINLASSFLIFQAKHVLQT
jgi:MFS family permease